MVADRRQRGRRVTVLHDDDLVALRPQPLRRAARRRRDGVEVIVAVLPPAAGLGHAIRDRLLKAAACRS